MTNDAESTPASNNQAAFAKQYPNKNANRWSDESNNACVKVTTHSSDLQATCTVVHTCLTKHKEGPQYSQFTTEFTETTTVLKIVMV